MNTVSNNRTLDAGIGFAGGTSRNSVTEVAAEMAWASDAGFDAYWLSHIFGVDPLVALAVGAPGAPKLAEVGTSVVPFAGRHPIALAQMARTTQQACEGRLTLGVGPSHEVVVEAVFGGTWTKPVQRTREYLDALLPLCAGEAAFVDGEQIAASAALDVPCEPVPVVLAALGPAMLGIAGARTMGTHTGSCGPKTINTHIAPRLNAAAEAAGRSRPRIIALVTVCVTNDPSAAIAEARDATAGYAGLPSYRAMLDIEGVESPADLMLVGSIDQIVEGLAGYVDAGATDLRIGAFATDPRTKQASQDALAEALFA